MRTLAKNLNVTKLQSDNVTFAGAAAAAENEFKRFVLKSAPNRQAIFGPEAKKQYLCIVKTRRKTAR